MSCIKRVEISGFWGDRNLTLNLFEDVNFLIGPNGSGKTTAINTIAAALTGDFANLDRLPFHVIKITLHSPAKERRQQLVEVTKKERPGSPFPAINYSVKDGSGKADQYSLDAIAEERAYRDYYAHARLRQSLYRRAAADLTQRLEELAPTSWLSIHRATGARSGRDERSHEFTVDQKLDEISNLLVRYFSELEKRSTDEAHKFQEEIFLSLLYKHEMRDLFHAVQDLNIKREQEALIDIFRNFKVPEASFLKKTLEHFTVLSQAVEQFGKEKSYNIEDVFIIMNSWRIHSIIQEWNSLINKQKTIFQSRDTFLNIINDMLQRKKLEINEKNEIFARTQSGKELSPSELSSGEKQLLIILGEALLQRGAPWIYIADEPELSLHVDWQVKLVDNLRQMNPASQIIVATHSPDIVSHYADRVHDMEELLS